jgi:hypothetical protein
MWILRCKDTTCFLTSKLNRANFYFCPGSSLYHVEVCPGGPPVLFSIRVFIVLVMDTYTVILGYLDNSSDYSLEHVQADSPKRAIECAKIAKWSLRRTLCSCTQQQRSRRRVSHSGTTATADRRQPHWTQSIRIAYQSIWRVEKHGRRIASSRTCKTFRSVRSRPRSLALNIIKQCRC